MASTAALFEAHLPSDPSVSTAIFSGPEFEPERDAARLLRQVDCIRDVALELGWITIQKLAAALRKRYPTVGFPENSIQAQLRNLRKVGYTLERRHKGHGLFEYRLLPKNNPGVCQQVGGVA